MTIEELNRNYAEICDNLSSRKLKPSFDLIGKLITNNSLGEFNDEYLNLEETYHYMLKYTVEGIKDPERQKIYQKLIISVFELNEKLHEALRLKGSPSIEYEKKRLFKELYIQDISAFISALEDYYLQNDNLSPDDEKTSGNAAASHQKEVRKLFYHIWFRDKLTPEEIEALRLFFLSPVINVSYKSFVVSALMLSLQRFFDLEKFNVLFELYESQEAEINQRALVGLLINLYRYNARMPFFPSLTGRLKILNETPLFKQNLESIIIQFIRSKETEKLQQRIRDEILPEMIRISPILKDKINLDSLMEEGLSEDKNPEWEEIFKDSPDLVNKMEEFSELQMEGADVFMGSFAMLKSFPFYNEMSNWFIPFFPANPEIADFVNVRDEFNNKLMDAISKAPILCNSDKYSFCFSIQSLPIENREFLEKGINAELSQLKELEEDEILLNPRKKAEFISNQYIQDLYRFYKLFPRKSDFEDIFKWRFDFHNKLILGEILNEDARLLRNIGEFYFVRNYFEEAAEIFNHLIEVEQTGDLYQKIAYCHQKTGKFSKALENYLKAELYDINRLWNLKKIALCYRNLKQPAEALKYYRSAEKLDPDNLNNHLNIGHCLLELNEYEEALKVYFKVEYLAPGNNKVWRPIAWCSFLSGKKEQAEKYLLNLIKNSPNKHDFMNMGHVQWSLGRRKEALNYYQKSISKDGFTEAEFLEIFDEDLPHIIKQGIDEDDVPIMLDQLRYFVEG